MSRNGKAAAAFVSILFLLVLAAGGFWFLRDTKPQVCPICMRGIHRQASAVIEVEGRRETVCCIRCGLTHSAQIGKPARIVQVTDYLTSRPLPPDGPWYVEGPRVSLCDPHDAAFLDQTKHPYARVFDRCEPSTYAFSRREDAEAFMRENSGVIIRWSDLRKEAGKQP